MTESKIHKLEFGTDELGWLIYAVDKARQENKIPEQPYKSIAYKLIKEIMPLVEDHEVEIEDFREEMENYLNEE